MSTHQQRLDQCKEIAENVLRKELVKGKRFDKPGDVRKYLQDYGQDYGWGKEFFQILGDMDCITVYHNAGNIAGVSPTSAPRPGIDAITPPSSASGTEDLPEGAKEGCRRPSYDDPVGLCNS